MLLLAALCEVPFLLLLKDQCMLLPEACSMEVSPFAACTDAGRSGSQALHLCKVQFPVSGLRLTAGQCTTDVFILLVRHAILQLRTLARH